MSSRKPQFPGWRRGVYEVQSSYSQASSSLSFDQQQKLTESLKDELDSIRNHIRDDMLGINLLVNGYDQKDLPEGLSNDFYESMRGISIDCSEKMAAFAGRIMKESVDMLQPSKPPCDFAVVAIGSLARGEATPYSDLEYFFLVDEKSPETVDYFERLAITTYFQIGNLGETKLSYMSIKELEGWFHDQAKNGFKIDGLSDKAGNIPTGNGSSNQHNHFIVTPSELAERYQHILDNPDREIALRGDLTAMLTYMKSIYTHQSESKDILEELRLKIRCLAINQIRGEVNQEMLETDVRKFNFKPSYELYCKGFAADVKRELYRFPSILLLDISIVTQTVADSSWASLMALGHEAQISESLYSALRILLAAAAYMRLAAYLYHDSQDDRVSVAQVLTSDRPETIATLNKSQSRWFIPNGLFMTVCNQTVSLKRNLAKSSSTALNLRTLELHDNDPWSHITTLFFTGRSKETLAALKQIYGVGLCDRPLNVISKMAEDMSVYLTLNIISETLFLCGEYAPALRLYEHMTEIDVSDEKDRISDCHRKLGDFNRALAVLLTINKMSANEMYSLGQVYYELREYSKAEKAFLQALEQFYYSEVSSEKFYDYYGDEIKGDVCKDLRNTDFTNITPPKERLSNFKASSQSVIKCVSSLGYVYNKQEKYSDALLYCKKSLQLISDLYGEDASVPVSADTLNNIGIIHRMVGRYDVAVYYYNQSIKIHRTLTHGASSSGIAHSLNNLGIAYSFLGQWNKATDHHKQALAVYQDSPQGADICIAESLYNIGLNYRRMGHYREAEVHYKQALEIYENLPRGADKGGHGSTLNNLGENSNEMGQYSEAEEYYKLALAVFKRYPSSCDITGIGSALNNLGENCHKMAQYSEAEDYYKQALHIYRAQSNNPNSNKIAATLRNLGNNCLKSSQYEHSVDFYRQALAICEELDDTDSRDIAHTLCGLAFSCYHAGDSVQVVELLLKALKLFRAANPRHNMIGKILTSLSPIACQLAKLGHYHYSRKEYNEATQYYRQVLDLRRASPCGTDGCEVALALCNLASIYGDKRERGKALVTLKEAEKIYTKVDPDNSQIGRIRHYLKLSVYIPIPANTCTSKKLS